MGGKYSKMDPMDIEVPQIENLFARDSYLKNYEREIRRRYGVYKDRLDLFEESDGGLEEFTKSYKEYGMHVQADNSIKCMEWAPAAKGMWLTGTFNGWDRSTHAYEKKDYGKWELLIPPKDDGSPVIDHLSEVKVVIENYKGEKLDRLSPYAPYVVQPPKEEGTNFKQLFYNPPDEERYKFKHDKPKKPKSMRIYECHIGIATHLLEVGTYDNFTDNVLPRIVNQGYNTIQIMAIMEHAYYASFGYQVTSFFAASSRFGNPEDLKRLVDRAHELGIYVMLDIVHSHASKNVLDGLNEFDGTDGCYFVAGREGTHTLWDSRLFDYSEYEVMRFLLSNLRWWMDEYRFDGFRFDGCTSIMYHSRGIGQGFSGLYDEYFGMNSDTDGLIYLMLANYVVHHFNSEGTTIAEDVSGMPGACRPIDEGGLGFDYRLAMAIPDKWIEFLRNYRDEHWSMGDIVHTLTNRRWMEPNIAYAESHDQALVGDKTLAFWLMDREMYSHMSTLSPPSTIIDRGLALHKMIRFLTYGLGGEGWLNFMGNEFGHPEWLDFPRAGNNNSYHYARRQWGLVDNELLKYKFLNNFDRAMNRAEQRYGWLAAEPGYVNLKHELDKVIVFERAGCIFIFNFHVNISFPNYRIAVQGGGVFRAVFSSDELEFGGFNRIDDSLMYYCKEGRCCGRSHSLNIYLPCRTCVLLAKIETFN